MHYEALDGLLSSVCCRSGLEQDDMRVMYRYLITSLFPSNMEHEFQGSQQGGATSNSAQTKHYGK